MTMLYVLPPNFFLPSFSVDAHTDPSQERLTAKEAMAHPYFAPIRDPEILRAYLDGTLTQTQF